MENVEVNTKEIERRNKRYERVKQKVNQEYLEEAQMLRDQADYLPEYEYFVQLLERPYVASELQERVGKPLVGLFCLQAPLEIIAAFDLHPIKLTSGGHTASRVAAGNLPVIMCPMLKSFVGSFELQNGKIDEYKLVLVPTTCDWVVKLPEIIGQGVEKIHYMEMPHLKDTEKAEQHWMEEVYGMKKALEQATGKKLDRKKLEQAIDDYSYAWGLMDMLTEYKRKGVLSGTFFTAVCNCFMLDKLEIWCEKVEELLKKLAVLPEPTKALPRVFVAGSPIVFPNLKMLQLLEQAGMQVCADDMCSSERMLPGGVFFNDKSEIGMLKALADRYHKACICPTFADNKRRIHNIFQVADDHQIAGVVYNILKGCHPYDIEAITIEKGIKGHGLKFLKLETDYGREDSANLLTRLEAFRMTLEHKEAGCEHD